MGITGLIPFLEKASRRTNVSEFSGCTVVIDSYCWLHKGAFACADKLVRGEETDIHIKYCLKYVNMLLSKNIKPILVFDGRHLPAKAMTEAKRRESRDISKKRAAELLSLGKIDEARSYMRRSVDITHSMALNLIQECRARNVDCIVAPYEADAQLAYLNMKNVAQLVITEDSDLILFGCNKVLFKMDLDGMGTLVETAKLPLVMKCPIEHYRFDKFRQMCIMSGCDYLASLPGIGLAKARQFVNATQDSNFANALKKLPSFFNRSSLTVTDEYRENFLKAEATFKHQYVYDPIERQMVRLTEPDDEDTEKALCVNAGELLDSKTAFQLALGNLDPFSLRKMDDWHPDHRPVENGIKTNSWKDKGASHPSMWSPSFSRHLRDESPWLKKVKKVEPVIAVPTVRARKVVNMVAKAPETQDESLSIETLSNMYCVEPALKKPKLDPDATLDLSDTYLDEDPNRPLKEERNLPQNKSPILLNKQRSFKKSLTNTYSVLKRLSKFPRTTIDSENVVESKFFNGPSVTIEESPERISKNPFKIETKVEIDSQCSQIEDSQLSSSQKENSPCNSPVKLPSPVLEPSPRSKNVFRLRVENETKDVLSEESVIENTYPLESLVTPVDSQESFGASPPKPTWLGIRTIPSSQPASQPASQSASQLTSQPASQPGSQPGTRPASQPASQLTSQPASQPGSQPGTRPASQPASQLTSQPASQPGSQPGTRPASQPASQLTSQPASQPGSQPGTRSASQPASQLTSQPASQPGSQPGTRPASQPASQLTSQPASQPGSQPGTRPASQPASQLTSQPASQPGSQPGTRPASQPASQLTSQPASQPGSQPGTRPASQPASQLTSQPASQPGSQPGTRPASQPASQLTSQPARNGLKKSTCRVPGLKRTVSVPSNQPTLLSKFGFQKKPVLKR